MAIATNPQRKQAEEAKAENFITGAGKTVKNTQRENAVPMMLRCAPSIQARAKKAAARLGISKSALIVMSLVEKLESMGE